MNIKEYLKERGPFLFINFAAFIIIGCILLILDIESIFMFLIFTIWFLPLMSYIIIEFLKYKKYYDNMKEVLESLDKKYLLPEIMEKPEFLEGKLFHEILRECDKEMHEHVNHYKNLQLDYREYIETWVHEIKTPIASSMLIIENNKNSIMNNVGEEIKKIEGFVEQALYYSRSSDVSKDYIVKRFNLKTAVNNTIRKNSKDFINNKISLQLDDIDGVVYSDIKWVQFILNQIITNSIKYVKPKEGKIRICSSTNKNNIILTIEDNGIGIPEKDINRVFEKGFTGEHGRKYNTSTGIGLYLCKKLCNKLGLDISITSQLAVGTKVNIIFPLSEFNLGI
ncbi:sensor histidine kinase [Oceanirhabdus seepicola]|uniref:histidine kinase n=1 Tax=Oceanirhabdus seepicola TaxID=2828781 RepID=A0A9J6P9Y8_9CLOT|nr:sensor histidine kinase [Oceanirhabdus seepicola]MCM1992229.1 sensor histidine kinase [Oceanirhabdus seepicola]